MYICKVQGKCVSTIKEKGLTGYSLITMQRLNKSGNVTGEMLVAVDTIGCSAGEIVLCYNGCFFVPENRHIKVKWYNGKKRTDFGAALL